jgi:hypothetical protein
VRLTEGQVQRLESTLNDKNNDNDDDDDDEDDNDDDDDDDDDNNNNNTKNYCLEYCLTPAILHIKRLIFKKVLVSNPDPNKPF